MSKHKPLWILLAQTLLFYLLPPLSKPLGVMGMLLLLVAATFVLALLLGGLPLGWLKWAYPLLVAVLFLPSVLLYYNASALVHALWYLVIAFLGVAAGALHLFG